MHNEAVQKLRALQECSDPGPVPFREQVANQLANANKEVQRLTELSELLDRNTEVQRILELMGQRY